MLDVEIMQEEYARSYVDKTRIYFIEKYYSTFSGQFGKMIPIILFPRQKVFLISIRDNKATIAIKPRQSGISTITSAWAAAQCVFASTESPETILCIANKLEQAQELLVKICEFLDQTPRWFWGEDFYSDDPKSENNKRSIYIKKNKSKVELFNGCVIHARAASANAARGISAVSILIFDEAAFIEEGPASYASAVAATSSVPNSKIIMVSTPNGKDQLYFATYRQALAHENNYNAVEFRWYQDPRYNKGLIWIKKNENGENEVIKEKTINEQGDIEYNEEHWADMIRKGYTPFSEWYDMMCKSFNNDSIKIAQELDVSFMGSADNVVDPEYINMQERLNVKEPLTDFNDPMVEESWFWKAPIDGHRYILACDPSRGSAADSTAIEIIDMDGRDENNMPIIEQVMEFVGKKFGDEVGRLLYRYGTLYNNAHIVVDATGGQGDAAILSLLSMGYKNLYYEDMVQKTYTIQNQTNNELQYENKLPGFHFQGNRYPVLAGFAGDVKNNAVKIRSVRVINQLDTWIFKGDSGRMDHMNGAHDDCICALAMALFVMKYSFNKIEAEKAKDAAILKSYMSGGGYKQNSYYTSGKYMNPTNTMPFFSSNNLTKKRQNINGQYLWLFAGTK